MKKNLLAVCAALTLLAACGKNDTPPAPAAASAPPAATAPAPAPVAENVVGKSVYGKTCAMCHAAGIGGAPKPKDKADWTARLAKGKDVLYKHAIEGYSDKGAMPARGGNPSLSDDEMKASVDYMLAQAGL